MDLIRKILREYDEDEEDKKSIFDQEMFSEKVYQKIFRIFDKHVESNPNFIFDFLRGLNLFDEDIRSEDLESNIIYKYLTEHKDRPDSYIKISYTPEEMSDFFCDDREYNIRDMVRGYFKFDYDYGAHYDCYDYADYYFDKIDKENLGIMKKHYLKNLEGEPTEEDFKEFVEEEFGDYIGCAAGDAQHSADIDVLHSDFEDGITDYLSSLNGGLQPSVDKEGNQGHDLEYVGRVELGDMASSSLFKENIRALLTHGYTTFEEIFGEIISDEQDGYSYEYNYFLPEDCISINTYKHFRYGGAGDIDWKYFNEILLDRIDHY
jgi:hypothetical protein